MSKRIHPDDVALHKKEGDIWVIIEGVVYDLSTFTATHPGGKRPLIKHAGTDATKKFHAFHDVDDVLRRYGDELRIGVVDKTAPRDAPGGGGAPPSGPVGAASGFTFGTWSPPSGSDAVPLPVVPAVEPQTRTCGGTAHLLPAERTMASFPVSELTTVIDGNRDATKRRRWLWGEGDAYDNSILYGQPREDVVAQHVERFLGIHSKFTDGSFRPNVTDITTMSAATRNAGALSLHWGAFVPTLVGQGNAEQVMEWLPPAYEMKIIGCLAQTELGAGSNVRALQTTATYDPTTEEFELHTPTLRAMKWWPGGLGKTGTHAALYAQLVIRGEEKGFHVFLVQLRDEEHRPLPGVEVGEVGPKIGDNHTETGFLRLTHVRIPRTWMLMKNQQVTADGTYVKKATGGGGNLQYLTMLSIRAALVMGAGYRLAQGVTIATRYSCVREQGFKDAGATSRFAPQRQVLDWQVQSYRVLKQLSVAYAFVFTGKFMNRQFTTLRDGMEASSETPEAAAALAGLPETHATSAGLKALCTFTAAEGLEECRKCCGGHGVLLASGVAQMALDYVTYVTAEGDRIILHLQSARFLMKQYRAALDGAALSGLCTYLAPLSALGFAVDRKTAPAWRSDLEFVRAAFEHRALFAVVQAGERLHALLDAGVSRDDAWNACAIDLVHASRAHGWFVVLRSFTNEVATLGAASPVKAVLERVAALFALSHMQDATGEWPPGYLSRAAIARVRATVRDLLSTLRPDAVALTDAFEFPDNVLNSALGRHDGRVYESLYAAAKGSKLNEVDPFVGYDRVLGGHVDKEFLREHAAMMRVAPRSKL